MGRSNDNRPDIHITGSGTVKRDATYAIISLHIEVETRHDGNDPTAAANTESTDRVALATTELRRTIEPLLGKEVISWKTSGLSAERKTRWEAQPDDGSRKITVSSAEVTVTVSCRPVDGVYAGLNSIARQAMAMRDVSLKGVDWCLDAKARRAAGLEARAAAAADAREQADVYARAIWGKADGQGIRCVYLRDSDYHGGGRSRMAARKMVVDDEEEEDEDLGMVAEGGSKAPLELEPEKSEFSASIETTWEVDD